MAAVIFQMPFRNYTSEQGAILPDEEALRLEAAGVVRIVEDDDAAAAEIAAGGVDYVRPAIDLPPPPEPPTPPEPEHPYMEIEEDGTVSSYTAAETDPDPVEDDDEE